MESIGYYHNYIKIIMMCNGVSNLNVSNAFPYKIFTEISPRFLNLGGQNPAEISRRPKSCQDSEILAAKILPRFLNLGGKNTAEIWGISAEKSCRDSRQDYQISVAKVLPRISPTSLNLGRQTPAVNLLRRISRKDAIVY